MSQPANPLLPPALYVNFLRVAHQPTEFFLSFGQTAQEPSAGAHLVASLVTSPGHAKAMLQALAQAVERYEQRFGPISLPEPARAPTRLREAPGAQPRGGASATAGDDAPPQRSSAKKRAS